jgi:hypothetical protein
MSLAEQASVIRHIAHEGLLNDEIARLRTQRAWVSWITFAGGISFLILGALSSALIAQETGKSGLVTIYERYEAANDAMTRSLIAVTSLGFASSELDKPFLPDILARNALQNEVVSNADPLPIYSESRISQIEYLYSEVEQAYTLAGRRIALLPICRDLQIEKISLLSELAATSLCKLSLWRESCRFRELARETLVIRKEATERLLNGCNTTEGILAAIESRGKLHGHAALKERSQKMAAAISVHLASEIPYTNLTEDYILSMLDRIDDLKMNSTNSTLLEQAYIYYSGRIKFTFLSTIRTLIKDETESYTALREASLNGRHTREDFYRRARIRVQSETLQCLETNHDSLICKELVRQGSKLSSWIDTMERFQLHIPDTFFDLAFEAILTPELIPVISIRDYQRYKRVAAFSKAPSWSFLILMSLFGIGGFVLMKLLFYDFVSVYLRLLILPGEYLVERMQRSIEDLRGSRGQLLLNG